MVRLKDTFTFKKTNKAAKIPKARVKKLGFKTSKLKVPKPTSFKNFKAFKTRMPKMKSYQ